MLTAAAATKVATLRGGPLLVTPNALFSHTGSRRGLLVVLILIAVVQLPLAPARAALPPDFEDTFVAGVSGPTDLTWTPDGRMLVTSKGGQLRVVQNGTLLSTPAIDLAARMCTNGERGLVGVTVHPNFAVNRYIYLFFTFNKFGTCNESEIDGPVNRLSRFTLPDSNVIDPASELVLFDTPPMFRDHHTGGDLKFGKDGYLYVTVGDTGTARFGWPQDAGRLLGKIVRLTDTGGIPADNPFTGAGTARCNLNGVPPSGSPSGTKCQEVFSQGLRNPFRFAFDPNASGVRYYINDVGQHTWEDISEGPLPGGDYGWPVREGPCAKDSSTDCGPPPIGMTNPVHWYAHGPNGAAVTGGAFVPNGAWPASFDGTYLFADYVFGQIYQLKPGGTACPTCSPPTSGFVQTVFSDTLDVVSMEFGPHGTGQALYYVTRNGSEVRRIAYTGTLNRAPIARATANPTSGDVPLTVQFDGTTSSDPDGDPLTYEWDFQSDGTPDSTAAAPSHTYTTAGTYFAKLTVRDGRGGENSATVRIDAGNTPPTPTIEAPAEGTRFAVGEQFTLRGSATDPQDGALPDSALTWEVVRHHATHTHPFLDPTPGNNIPITGPEPEEFAATTNTYLEIKLTATDSNGLSRTVTRNLHPKTVDITFQTNPSGLNLTVNDNTIVGASTVVSWEAWALRVNAPNQTDGSGKSWAFESWSDGGAQAHTITTPASPATYTATFTQVESSVLTFSPTDDAYVVDREPNTNFGGATSLQVDNSPVEHILMKFQVSGVGSRTVESAKLRLFCTDGSSVGGQFRRVASNSWSEGTVTWNNAPAADTGTVATLGKVSTGVWYEVDLASLVTGDGAWSLRVTSTTTNGADYTSEEGSAGFRPQLVVTVAGGSPPPPPGDTTRPTAPTSLTATAVTSNRIDLTWNASTDDVGVTAYEVFRNGSLLTTIGATTSYSDTTVAPSTTYQYQVRARDAAGNVSDLSNIASATTPGTGTTTLTFQPVADTYASSAEPTRNFGTSSSLRTDGSPDIRSFLRFDPDGVGAVSKAILRVYANTSNSIGIDVRGVTTNAWGETTLTYNNMPGVLGVTASSGRITGGTWVEWDVTPLITALASANDPVSFALTSTSTTATSLASRESTNRPQLAITFG